MTLSSLNKVTSVRTSVQMYTIFKRNVTSLCGLRIATSHSSIRNTTSLRTFTIDTCLSSQYRYMFTYVQYSQDPPTHTHTTQQNHFPFPTQTHTIKHCVYRRGYRKGQLVRECNKISWRNEEQNNTPITTRNCRISIELYSMLNIILLL
jgi:hypothetical protein